MNLVVNDSIFDLVIVGVGGQGIVLLTQIIGSAAVDEGLEAMSSEVHGMAQRGGRVISFVRVGRNVYASTVAEGLADAILALEPAETLNVLRYANSSTTILINTSPMIPPSVTMELASYPSLNTIFEKCLEVSKMTVKLNAAELAAEVGSVKMQNIVMLGCLVGTGLLPLKKESLKRSIRIFIPKKYVKDNLKAFELGSRVYLEQIAPTLDLRHR